MSAAADGLEAALRAAAPDLPAPLCRALASRGRRIRCPDGAQLFGPGDGCQSYVIPLAGGVRVEHIGSSGRSIVLYRVGPGDSCVMTTSCLLSGAPYSAYGIAEGELDGVALSSAAFRELVEREPAFRDLAFSVFSRRILELVEVIDELLLHRVDLRLAQWLADRGGASASLQTTHQAIASELGTAREVVSRILKDFERRGWVATGRGALQVLAPEALGRFAAAGAG